MREKLLMNRGWLYHFGEPEYLKPKPTSSDQTYRGSRSENARGPARRDFDDSAWKQVTLPHDFVNENGPDYKNCKPGEKHRYPLDRARRGTGAISSSIKRMRASASPCFLTARRLTARSM